MSTPVAWDTKELRPRGGGGGNRVKGAADAACQLKKCHAAKRHS